MTSHSHMENVNVKRKYTKTLEKKSYCSVCTNIEVFLNLEVYINEI